MGVKASPRVGDLIWHKCALNGEFTGVVHSVYSSQFVYVTAKGEARFCTLGEKWEYRGQEEIPEIIPAISPFGRPTSRPKRSKERSKAQPESPSAGPLEMDMAAIVNKEMEAPSTPRPKSGESVLDFIKRTRGTQ